MAVASTSGAHRDSPLRLPPAGGATTPPQAATALRVPGAEPARGQRAVWNDVRRMRVGGRVLPTGVESFDVECWVLASCLERMEAKLRGRADITLDLQRKNQMRAQLLRGAMGLAPVAEASSESLRTAEFATDPVLSELGIVRNAVSRMQEEVRELVGRSANVHQVEALQQEILRLRQELEDARQPTIDRPHVIARTPLQGQDPLATTPTGETVPLQLTAPPEPQRPAEAASPEPHRTPAEDAARRFRDLYPDCFWSQVVLMLQHGNGNYDLLTNMQDPEGSLAFPPRTRLRKEAGHYGLDKTAETLSLHRSAAVLIRRLFLLSDSDKAWSSSLMRPSLCIGGGEVLTTRKGPSPPPRAVPRRCKGIISYLGTKATRRSEVQWTEASFENPSRGSIEVMVACSSVWGKSDPCNVVDERMEFFSTQDRPGQWVAVDFIDAVVIPHAYSFVSFHPIMAGYFPRNWEFQGSMDGRNWHTLTRHVDDQKLSKGNPVGTWVVHAAHPHRTVKVADPEEAAEQKRTSQDVIQDRVRQLEAEGLDAAQLRMRLALTEHRLAKAAGGDPSEGTHPLSPLSRPLAAQRSVAAFTSPRLRRRLGWLPLLAASPGGLCPTRAASTSRRTALSFLHRGSWKCHGRPTLAGQRTRSPRTRGGSTATLGFYRPGRTASGRTSCS
eukprot:TRINITY_DN11123_c0_g1_i1.p1 TRINITY_DN11123_c0_g1~~TRINITY_DN11123_c0_g1_i1.p1  ORF type:complete len:691 (+),score=133.76 TRINITY_DN11123_c0_g1_i1:66-2075(+)